MSRSDIVSRGIPYPPVKKALLRTPLYCPGGEEVPPVLSGAYPSLFGEGGYPGQN